MIGGLMNVVSPSENRSPSFPAWIIFGCITFNFFLCFINTNIFAVSSAIIIFCEVFLVCAAVIYGFFRLDNAKLYWLYILLFQLLLFVFLSILKDEMPIKAIRDLLIVPVFVVLGLSAARLNFTPFILVTAFIILCIALIEAFYADAFLNIFNFKEYYLMKGSLTDSEITLLNTFASGVRPDGRFLIDIPGVHRISSLFLEPVSLGFYAFIISLYAIAVRQNISLLTYISILLISLILIWLSDARMAFGCFIIMLVFGTVLKRLDHRFSVMIFPAIALMSFMLINLGLISTAGEGLGARLFSTMKFIPEIGLATLSGVPGFVRFTADSGAADLIGNMGILGLLLYWLPPIFFLRKAPPEARIYIYGVMLYMGIAFMISSAIFTIKTAALLWFCYGYIIARAGYLEEKNAAA